MDFRVENPILSRSLFSFSRLLISVESLVMAYFTSSGN